MELKYRLEFNEKQQNFHMERIGGISEHEENTYGWYTIKDTCTDDDFYILDSYIEARKIKKLTVPILLKLVKEIDDFLEGIKPYKLSIQKEIPPEKYLGEKRKKAPSYEELDDLVKKARVHIVNNPERQN